ncbi:unnamed protein product [Parnassius apollo]|uniref:(apollo) hypothetical protein n=1 Tax=Parnassius apollo TaxID=110799 RepID=A0A8S3W128_PARAO|nr:unnamed protein product [Parnassius apollo]
MDEIPIMPPDKARKRVIPKCSIKREKLKEKRYSVTGLPVKPRCNHKKQKQEYVSTILRTKAKSRENVQVYRQAFRDILRIKPNRLKGVLTRYWKSGCVAEEKRGGNRKEFDLGQEKTVIKFIQSFKPLDQHYTRVTGHSFVAADRTFALTDTQIRKLETIVDPNEYEVIIAAHATVHKLGTEVPVYDYRSAVEQAKQVQLGIAVNELKLKDVKNLLTKHYGSDWTNMEELIFYKKVRARDHRYLEIRDSDECCEHEIEEKLDFV